MHSEAKITIMGIFAETMLVFLNSVGFLWINFHSAVLPSFFFFFYKVQKDKHYSEEKHVEGVVSTDKMVEDTVSFFTLDIFLCLRPSADSFSGFSVRILNERHIQLSIAAAR